MKKYLIILLVLVSASMTAQGPEGRRGDRKMAKEKIQALQVAHITEAINLTADEATQFWPLFNEANDEHRRLEREKRKLIREIEGKIESLTDAAAQKYLYDVSQLEQQIYKAKFELNKEKIISIIGAKRYLMLKKAEFDFRRKMIDEFKERRGRR